MLKNLSELEIKVSLKNVLSADSRLEDIIIKLIPNALQLASLS
jgi:hypothetical protein